MKWVYALLVAVLVVATIPAAFAAIGDHELSYANQPDIFNAYYGAGSNACGASFRINGGYNTGGPSYSSPWPGNTCGTGSTYTYSVNPSRSATISTLGTANPASTVAITYHYTYCTQDEDDNSDDCEKIQDGWHTKYVDKTSVNNIAITNIPAFNNRPGFKIMRFGWCGESVNVLYNKSTLSPTSARVSFDSNGYCADRNHNTKGDSEQNGDPAYDSFAGTSVISTTSGGHDVFEYFGTSPLETSYYTLPLPLQCGDYAIDTQYTTSNDWPWKKESLRTIPDSYTFNYYSGQNSNTLNINLIMNADNYLSAIQIISKDGSPKDGGLSFSIYCLDPYPDKYKNSCPAPWAWSDVVNNTNPGSACCGNMPGDENTVFGDKQCRKYQNGTYYWGAASDLCKYPTGWTITGKTPAQVQADAANTYYDGFCCSDQVNQGKVITTSADQAVCTILPSGMARWLKASANVTVENITRYDNRTLVSNGSQWFTCNQAAPPDKDFFFSEPAKTMPRIDCYNETVDDQTYYSCPDNPTNLTCNENNYLCECVQPGFVWDAGSAQCVSNCTTPLTFNSSSGKCEGSYTYSAYSFGAESVCGITRNVNLPISTGIPYICHANWTKYDDKKYYFLNASKGPVPNTSPMSEVKYICKNEVAIDAIPRYNATKSIFGFCDPAECYYGPSAGSNTCVPKDSWVYNDYCADAGTSADWESRTRFLADALLNTTNNGKYVLHCDTDREAIERNAKILPYESKYVNAFCVLSSGGKVTIGVTLNPPDGNVSGNMPAIIGDVSQKPFVAEVLNNSREFGNFTAEIPCDDQISTTYEACNKVENNTGNIYYNNKYGTLVFAQGDFTPQGNFLTPIAKWWNSIIYGPSELPMPLSGQKIYVARGNDKLVQGRVYYVNGGTQEAKIVSKGLNATAELCRKYQNLSTTNNGRYNCQTTDPLTIVTIKRPTQTEWEDFTLRIRP